MSAQIVIDDGTNPLVIGSVDRDSTFRGVAFALSNFDDASVLAWRWAIGDKPVGSAAALTTAILAATGLTPDVEGGYLIRLETYLDAAATLLDAVDEQIVRVRFAPPFDWAMPAAGETVQLDSARGWASAREAAILQARRNLKPAIASPVNLLGANTIVQAAAGELVLYNPSGGIGPPIIRAPLAPVAGDRWAAKNVIVSVVAVDISGNGSNIEDPNTSTLVASWTSTTALHSLEYIYDGTNWLLA